MTKYIIFDQSSKFPIIKLINQLTPNFRWVVTVEKEKKKRTLNQNNLMWKWIDEVCQAISGVSGNSKAFLHKHFKEEFLTPEIEAVAGKEHLIWSTTGLSRQEMSEYMGRIEIFAAQEFGVMVSIPEELQRR